MGKKKKWITKAEVREILRMYSIRQDEFETMEKLEYHYKSKYAKGYVIAINPEEIRGKDVIEQTGRILVQHCKPSGDITHTDIWERTKDSKIQFFCRQEKGELPDSVAYVNDLREEIERLQKKNKDLQQHPLDANTNKVKEADAAGLKELLDAAISERNHYKELYQNLKNETDAKKKAGRKKRGESDVTKEMLELVRSILENEPDNKEPWLNLGISRASFFRYKKLILATNK